MSSPAQKSRLAGRISQTLLAFGLFLLLPSALSADEKSSAFSEAIAWEGAGLPDPPEGWDEANATVWNNRLVLIGGNQPVRWIDLATEQTSWEIAGDRVDLESPALLSNSGDVLILGGLREGEWSRQMYSWNPDAGLRAFADLPFPVVHPAVSRSGNAAHVAGFDQGGKLHVWELEEAGGALSPVAKAVLPGALAKGPIALVRQQDGDGHKLWVVADRWLAKVYPGAGTMSFLPIDGEIIPAAAPVGVGHLLIPGRDSKLYFHTVTHTWVQGPALPDGAALRLLQRNGSEIVKVISGDEGTIVRRGSEVRQTPRLSRIDFALLLGYFAIVLLMGNWFRLRGKNTRDYFVGGNRVPGWAAGLSIVLTNISAVSLLSLPAKSFATNWTFLMMLLTPLIAAPLVIKFVLPFFYNLRLTTAFEYLEMRFNVGLRSFGSLQYGVYEVCRMGVLILLPSIVLSVVTGIDVWICLLMIGVVSTIYTLLGGLEAVVWTDVMQAIIMVGGILFAVGLMVVRIDASPGELIAVAWDAEKFKMLDWSPNIADVTVWAFLLTLPVVLNGYVAHQPTVQRFVSTRNIKDAARGLWTTGISAPLILATIFLCGTALYLYYGAFPDRLNPTMEQPDQLLAWFIINELPVGMIGLLIGAIFAATMSSLDSGLSSLSSVFVTDFYRRFGKNVTERKAMLYAKASTAALGVLGTGFGLWLASMDVLSLFDAFISFASLLTGGLAGVFLLGIFTKRATGTGAFVGWAVSTALVYLVRTEGNVQFFLYATVGTVSCFAVGYAVSLFTRPVTNDLTNLTLWTRKEASGVGAGAAPVHPPEGVKSLP